MSSNFDAARRSAPGGGFGNLQAGKQERASEEVGDSITPRRNESGSAFGRIKAPELGQDTKVLDHDRREGYALSTDETGDDHSHQVKGIRRLASDPAWG